MPSVFSAAWLCIRPGRGTVRSEHGVVVGLRRRYRLGAIPVFGDLAVLKSANVDDGDASVVGLKADVAVGDDEVVFGEDAFDSS